MIERSWFRCTFLFRCMKFSESLDFQKKEMKKRLKNWENLKIKYSTFKGICFPNGLKAMDPMSRLKIITVRNMTKAMMIKAIMKIAIRGKTINSMKNHKNKIKTERNKINRMILSFLNLPLSSVKFSQKLRDPSLTEENSSKFWRFSSYKYLSWLRSILRKTKLCFLMLKSWRVTWAKSSLNPF